MTTQDPELSAALGWPGGISDPVLDRKTLLQMVAALRLASRQALEAICGAKLCEVNSMSSRYEMVRLMDEAITVLRAALAQQAEPVQQTRKDGHYSVAYRCKCGHEQNVTEIVQDGCTYVGSGANWCDGCGDGPPVRVDAMQQQTEPVEPVAWDVTKNGRLIYDYDFTHDVVLRVIGDFEDDEQRVRYAKQIVDKLNAALAQQAEPVQVAERERERIASQWDGCVTRSLDTFGPVDIGASIRAGELVEAQQDSDCLHGVEDGACKECYATEPDLSRCPQCNGPADNGFDRSFPPSPYLCTKCMAEPVEEGK